MEDLRTSMMDTDLLYDKEEIETSSTYKPLSHMLKISPVFETTHSLQGLPRQ